MDIPSKYRSMDKGHQVLRQILVVVKGKLPKISFRVFAKAVFKNSITPKMGISSEGLSFLQEATLVDFILLW